MYHAGGGNRGSTAGCRRQQQCRNYRSPSQKIFCLESWAVILRSNLTPNSSQFCPNPRDANRCIVVPAQRRAAFKRCAMDALTEINPDAFLDRKQLSEALTARGFRVAEA